MVEAAEFPTHQCDDEEEYRHTMTLQKAISYANKYAFQIQTNYLL